MECSVLLLDNSEFSRNGDFFPSRLDAQRDAAVCIFDAKIRRNIENTVGVLLMASSGSQPKVLLTPVSKKPLLEYALNGDGCKVEGTCQLVHSLKIAQLALKHRLNKNQAQRIIMFVCGPVTENTDELVALARKLKKNSVSIDLFLFGDAEESLPILTAFIEAVDNGQNSRMVVVPANTSLVNAVRTSRVLSGGAAASDGGAGVEDDGFGMMDEDDPEMAMAIRMSLEEHARMQEQVQQSSEASAETAPHEN